MKAENYEIVGSYNNQIVSPIDAERTVNLYEYIDPIGKKPHSLIYTSGLINTNFSFTGQTKGFRAQFVFNGVQYGIVGTLFYSINAGGNLSPLGQLTTDSGYVGITANTFQIIMVDGAHGYVWDTLANTFTIITDSSFPADPIDVTYLDGFFIVANGGTNSFQLSSFDQGMVWGPAANNFTGSSATSKLTIGASTFNPPGPGGTVNYATGIPVQVSNSGGSLPNPLAPATTYYVIHIDSNDIKLATSYENAIAGTAITLTTNGTGTQTITSLGQLQQGFITSNPGTIVACRTLHRRLFLFSQNFTEVWENAGIGTNLPFRRNNSLLMQYGTPAIGSIDVSFDTMIFLSQTTDGLGSVMQVTGTQAIPISTNALNNQLAQYASSGKVSDCSGFMVKENGVIFYRMNFTAANHTFVYNLTMSDPSKDESKRWHEEEILNGNRHPAQTHAYFNGINYVGHYNSPILYKLDSNTYTNDGQSIRRMRIGRPIVPPGYQRIRIDRFQVDLLQGNVALMESVDNTLFLATEVGDLLTTESSDNLILEQSQPSVTTFQQPAMFFSYSKDGGQTYGYIQRVPMGNIGQRTFRTLVRKLGTIPRGQAFVPKIEFYDQIPIIIMGASWCYEIMPE